MRCLDVKIRYEPVIKNSPMGDSFDTDPADLIALNSLSSKGRATVILIASQITYRGNKLMKANTVKYINLEKKRYLLQASSWSP